jgi:general secretion pathway protein H
LGIEQQKGWRPVQRGEDRYHRKKQAGGFTFLELILVMLILGVSAALVAPMIGHRLTRGDPQQVALRIRSAIELMRVYAVQRGQEELLIVAPRKNTYWHDRTGKLVEIPPEDGLLSAFGQWVNNEEEVEFRFYPDGTNSGGQIRLEKSRGAGATTYIVSLDPLLGSATMSREDG